MKNYFLNTTKVLTLSILSCAFLFGCSTEEVELEEVAKEETVKTDSFFKDVASNGESIDLNERKFQLDGLEIDQSWGSSTSATSTSFSFPQMTVTDYFKADDEEENDGLSDRIYLNCQAEDGNRSEFREPASVSSSLNTYRKFNFTAFYYNIPSNGVTIAQVHNTAENDSGEKKPYIRVELEHDGRIEIVERFTPESIEGDVAYKNYVENADGSDYIYEGKRISIRLEKYDGKVHLRIRNKSNNTVHDQTYTPSSAWSNHANDYYLKAGVYTEGSDVAGEVKYSWFKYFN